ncbi:hypothetical protein GCK72_001597 [Caenorhabditis remanei]|uniref:Uncharacterized protein n=1 Tax=Caenorhabditis remanei TaxID=31234 RepID=A0A6A5HNE8_CAERE|nr:hypothetical protein GCK72_001597 [Caenorhabditis remanei]KAF1769780.1 hypothetical protein GCK72_001597 [Caenorhabditis remanei]
MKMMRWNRILPILLGVMLISKGSVNGQDQDDDDYWGNGGEPEVTNTPTYDYRQDAETTPYYGYDDEEETTEFNYRREEATESDNGVEETTEYNDYAQPRTEPDDEDDDVPTTEEPVTSGLDDYTYAETEAPEFQFGGSTTEDPLGLIPTAPQAPVDPFVTDASESITEETTVEPIKPTPFSFPWDTDAPAGTKTEETTVEPIQTTAKDPSHIFGKNATERTTAIQTTEDPWFVPFGTEETLEETESTQAPATNATPFMVNVETSTDASVDEPTIVGNPQVIQRGGAPRPHNPIDPAVLESLPTNLSLDTLPDGRPIKDLGEEFEVVGAGGVAGGDFSKIIANKHGFYVLHPVQTKAKDIIFDPYTIGQVLGYLYEFNEFGGQRPKDGWTAELMGYKIPQLIKKKRSAGIRRATLVFKKKPEVVAKEEKEYWKQFIASI